MPRKIPVHPWYWCKETGPGGEEGKGFSRVLGGWRTCCCLRGLRESEVEPVLDLLVDLVADVAYGDGAVSHGELDGLGAVDGLGDPEIAEDVVPVLLTVAHRVVVRQLGAFGAARERETPACGG